MMSTYTELLWAFIGLLLTIGSTFLEAFVAMPSLTWGPHGLHTYSLGVTYQVGAVLLVGCLGGKNAAALAQLAYLLLGLTWFPVFAQGGGIGYLTKPSFGYLLGFVPGAWLCGYLAFKTVPRLESLMLSCLWGLLAIHLIGISYLTLASSLHWVDLTGMSLMEAIVKYSLSPLPGHLAIVCAVTVLAFTLRHLMFY